MSTATDLRAAADYLRRYGWIRNSFGEDNGPRCILGAVSSVTGLKPWLHENGRWGDYHIALREVCGVYPCEFNDDDCETADDAIAVLEIAADLATPSPKTGSSQ